MNQLRPYRRWTLWRSLKYEEVYLNAYATVAEAETGIGAWLSFYYNERQHQSLGYRRPQQIYDRKAGKSSPSPTYPAPQPTKDLILMMK